jgi:uroporphyrinogen-III synthase
LTVRLLLTRPEPEAERTAAHLRAHGHIAVIAPLLRIEPIADAELGAGPWGAILVTSPNVALAIGAQGTVEALRALPVFAVGQRSAGAMRAAGFSQVTSADGDVHALARLVSERIKRGASLLYLAGAERSGDLAGDLSGRGFAVHTVIVYRAVAAEILPHAAIEALQVGIDGVLHFSRRSAEAYVNAARTGGQLAAALRPAHFCLSGQIAEPLVQAGAADIRIATQPTEDGLMHVIPIA